MRWEAGQRPDPGSLGLLPSGPDPVGEWLVHRQPPAAYIGQMGGRCKGEKLCSDGAFAGLELVAEEAQPMPDPFWPAFLADGDVEALAGRHLGFFRAPFLPSLLAALDPARDAGFRAAFTGRLEEELRRRMLAAPQPLLEPMTIHTALMRKVG